MVCSYELRICRPSPSWNILEQKLADKPYFKIWNTCKFSLFQNWICLSLRHGYEVRIFDRLPFTLFCELNIFFRKDFIQCKLPRGKRAKSYAYWTVHHLDIWIKVDQLDDTCFIMSIYYATYCGIRVQPALGYHITNSQSRYITPTRLKSAQYSLHNNAPSSRKLLKKDVLTSETCRAVNWHNKASVIKLVYLYSKCKILFIFLCSSDNSPKNGVRQMNLV